MLVEASNLVSSETQRHRGNGVFAEILSVILRVSVFPFLSPWLDTMHRLSNL